MRLTAIRDTLQDSRYAWRQLRHAPGFTVVAVLTLALGIGANTAFFAILDALSAAQRPSIRLDGWLAVTRHDQRTGRSMSDLSIRDFRTLERQPPDSIAGVAGNGVVAGVIIQGPGRAEGAAATFLPGRTAGVFGMQAQTGRWLGPDDDTPDAPGDVVVISDLLWRSWFNADRAIVGHASIKVNLRPFTVVGVALPEFHGADGGYAISTELWLPLGSLLQVFPDRTDFMDAAGFATFIRPARGVVPDHITADLRHLLPDVPAAIGKTPSSRAPVEVLPAMRVIRGVNGTSGAWLALSLSSLILIAACANLANMLYARGTQRAGETAVRMSLGASGARILRLFVAETAVIAALAATLGLVIAAVALRLFAAAAPAARPGSLTHAAPSLALNYRVFMYVLGAGALAAFVVGVTTSWRASRVPPLRTLASSGAPVGLTPRGGTIRTALVAIQITVAVVLVMTAGVMVERYQRDAARSGPSVRANYDEHQLASARVDLELLHYNEARGRAFFDELVTKVQGLPGVDRAAIADGFLTPSVTNLSLEDPPGGRVGSPRLTRVLYGRVSPSFLDTIGINLIRGRPFTRFDVPGATRVAIVSESAVASLWPGGEDPIGKRVKFGPWDWLTVVGVIADPVSSDDRGPSRPSNVMFIPFAQWYQPGAIVVVRSKTPDALLAPLRAAINAINEDVAVFDASTRDTFIRDRFGVDRAFEILMASLGALALGISMLGVYGVIAYFVSARTREFGIRIALGATPGLVLKLVLDHAIHLVLVGLLPGVFLVSVGSRFVQSQIRDMMPNDITTWVMVPLLILTAGLVAGYFPARRAARVDPNVALRDL